MENHLKLSSNKFDVLEDLFKQNKIVDLLELMEDIPAVEVSEFLMTKPDLDVLNFLELLAPQDRGSIFDHFPLDKQLTYFRVLDKEDAANIFERMSSEVRTDLYQEFDGNEQIELLPFLTKKVREDIISLSSYPPETAGGIMSTDFATVLSSMTALEAIEKIRSDAPSKKMVYYVYVVDKKMCLVGILTLKELILANPGEPIGDLVQEFFVYAHVNEDRESVAKKVEKYDLLAIPVLNSIHQLVGIVTHDDALDVIRAEQTEDMEKFMGIVPSEEELPYLTTSTLSHFKKRVFWLVALAAVGLISGFIIHNFKETLEKLIILAIYMPMMASTGGNTGSQAATVVIRAFALGEVRNAIWLKVIFKELKISILLALTIGVFTFMKIFFFTHSNVIPIDYSLSDIAFLISLAIGLQVITSSVIGAGLPILVRRLGGDPAVAASPAIATIVDITGLLIYFSVASLALS